MIGFFLLNEYKEINKNIVAMIAGSALLFEDLTEVESGNEHSYINVQRDVFENIRKKRREVIENEIFSIYGINQDFFIDSLKKQIPNPFVHTILEKVSKFQLNTSILLAGFQNEIAMISEINEGGIFNFRNINFHTIGSGAVQASNTLLFQKHSKSDNVYKALYNVYKAKRNAEVMQGVGKETDLLILTNEGVKKIDKKSMQILNDVYEYELESGKNIIKLEELWWS